MDFDKFLYQKPKFLNHFPFIHIVEKMNRENISKSNWLEDQKRKTFRKFPQTPFLKLIDPSKFDTYVPKILKRTMSWHWNIDGLNFLPKVLSDDPGFITQYEFFSEIIKGIREFHQFGCDTEGLITSRRIAQSTTKKTHRFKIIWPVPSQSSQDLAKKQSFKKFLWYNMRMSKCRSLFSIIWLISCF